VISRVADHCFWLGRYVERAESTARLLQVTRTLAFDVELPAIHCWRPLVIVSGQHPEMSAKLGNDATGNGEIVQRYMTWAPENPVSIRNSIRAAREGGRSIREVIGHEIWQSTNELYLWFMGEAAASQYQQDRDEVYREIRRSTQLCLGLVRSTMLHDDAMDFLWLGVLVERIGQTARTLDMHHHIVAAVEDEQQQPLLQTALWLSLLRACSGFEAFMRRQQGRVSREGAVSFLVFEDRFPRSLRYCLRSAVMLTRRLAPAAAARAATNHTSTQRSSQVSSQASIQISSQTSKPASKPASKQASDEEKKPLGIAAALARLEALDCWLDEQEKRAIPLTVHALLTHVVDETSGVCQELQSGLEGEATELPAQPEAAQ
jgi:uncharacterized alpha-E superfamily protein